MALRILRLDAFPNRIAATKVDGVVPGGAFFLDFSRPLKRLRWLGVQNFLVGPTVGLLVPVVHEGERAGDYIISVQRGQPYFDDLQALWSARYPEPHQPPPSEADSLEIVSHFAAQFPEDSK
jgi:hypothetical protein